MPLIILIFRDSQYLIALKISCDCINCAEGMQRNDSDHGSNNSELSPAVCSLAEMLLGQRSLASWAEILPLGWSSACLWTVSHLFYFEIMDKGEISLRMAGCSLITPASAGSFHFGSRVGLMLGILKNPTCLCPNNYCSFFPLSIWKLAREVVKKTRTPKPQNPRAVREAHAELLSQPAPDKWLLFTRHIPEEGAAQNSLS